MLNYEILVTLLLPQGSLAVHIFHYDLQHIIIIIMRFIAVPERFASEALQTWSALPSEGPFGLMMDFIRDMRSHTISALFDFYEADEEVQMIRSTIRIFVQMTTVLGQQRSFG